MNKSTTDTPRTDTCPNCGAKPMVRIYVCGTTLPNINGDCYVSDLCHERKARQKAEAEVEFWKGKAYEAEASEGKHEAEVERLRGSLRDQERSLGTSQFYLARAIEIAEIVGWTQNVAYLSELRAELDALKATLNPDK